MRRCPALFLYAFAGFAAFALGACGSPQKNTGAYEQKVKPVKRPFEPPPEDPVTPDVNAGNGATPPRDPIYFDFDTFTVREDSRPVLEKYAEYMNKNGRATMTIAGHTDDRGTTEYNLALGDQRAKAARDYLVRLGVDASRIEVISFGEERPAEPGSSEDAWSRNRRAEFDTSTTR
jgi:peptidoglycan-associated lipoprotein